MTISEAARRLNCEIIQGDFTDSPLSGGYTSDLLSDVMANAKAGDLFITIQAHKNSVAVAALLNLPAILVCNSRPISDDMRAAAKAENIALFRSAENQFQVSGRLYALLAADSPPVNT